VAWLMREWEDLSLRLASAGGAGPGTPEAG